MSLNPDLRSCISGFEKFQRPLPVSRVAEPRVPFCCRWIIHAMEYELRIRGGDQLAADLYQLSPSEVKQLLLDILQPQQNGR